MKTQSPDTHPEAERVLIALFQQADPARRFALARSLSQTTMFLTRRAIQRAHPEAGELEVGLIFVANHYGQQLADRLRADLVKRTGATPSMQSVDILAVLTPVVEAFEELGVSYHIGGSVASSVYGLARATAGIDLVADVRSAHVQPLVEQLHTTYYIDAPMIEEAIHHYASFNLIYLPTMMKVDVFMPKARAYDQQAQSRAREERLDEREDIRTFLVASPEDVVLAKLEWYEMGHRVSDRQWSDVLGVLKTQAATLDRHYLQRWATTLGLRELLAMALDDAGLS
jgi:hypothetical protein